MLFILSRHRFVSKLSPQHTNQKCKQINNGIKIKRKNFTLSRLYFLLSASTATIIYVNKIVAVILDRYLFFIKNKAQLKNPRNLI